MTTATQAVARSATVADVPAITRLYNRYVRDTAITFDIEEKSEDERAEWLRQFADEGPYRALVLCDASGALLGYATSQRFRVKPAYDGTVETTVYIDPDFVGRGHGAALYGALFAELEGLPLHRAVAGIVPPNAASFALHERFGFARVGVFTEVGWKFGRYWDVVFFEKSLRGA